MIGRLVEKLMSKGRLTLVMPDGKRTSYGPGGGASLTVRVTDRKTLFAIARNPRLGLGEAYMDGRLIVEDGTILDLMRLVVGANRWEDKGKGKWKALFRRNKAKASRRNVAHHYDIGNDLYRLFLDEDLQYSCAYFTDPANSLEQAQADKKAHIAAKLYLKAGQRVLDIGCGWGGTALCLNRVADVDVLGITLSEEQLKVARARAEEAGVADRVKFELIDYRLVEGRFDRIVSVGMFEHVGVPHYRRFFRKCRDLLTEDGVMLLHTIGRMGGPGTTDAFTTRYIFPGGYNPALSEIVAASEQEKMIAADVETLRYHYAHTLAHWYRRVAEKKAEIVALYDERFFRMWQIYLAGAYVAFRHGGMVNYQIQYLRSRDAVPIVRDYMFDRERALREAGPGPAQPVREAAE